MTRSCTRKNRNLSIWRGHIWANGRHRYATIMTKTDHKTTACNCISSPRNSVAHTNRNIERVEPETGHFCRQLPYEIVWEQYYIVEVHRRRGNEIRGIVSDDEVDIWDIAGERRKTYGTSLFLAFEVDEMSHCDRGDDKARENGDCHRRKLVSMLNSSKLVQAVTVTNCAHSL